MSSQAVAAVIVREMDALISVSSTALPSSIPLMQWVNNPSCSVKASAPGRSVDFTTTTLPLNWPARFALSIKKSHNPRSNTPVPNCNTFSGYSKTAGLGA